jgi:hypothetical protein
MRTVLRQDTALVALAFVQVRVYDAIVVERLEPLVEVQVHDLVPRISISKSQSSNATDSNELKLASASSSSESASRSVRASSIMAAGRALRLCTRATAHPARAASARP